MSAARPARPRGGVVRESVRASTRRRAPSRAGGERAPSRAGADRAPGLDRLWAPWRMAWLKQGDAPKDCLFCRVAASHEDRRDLVLARRPEALLMLNRYPYASAHLMVAVRRHAASFRDLLPAEGADLVALTALAEQALEAAYAPHGLNAGVNLGRVAGAGFPGHLHLHLVPRWDGDTNFMPMIAQTRVLPESLTDTWARLKRAVASLEKPGKVGKEGAGGATRR